MFLFSESDNPPAKSSGVSRKTGNQFENLLFDVSKMNCGLKEIVTMRWNRRRSKEVLCIK